MLNATNGAIGTTRVNGPSTNEPQSGVVRNTSIMGQGMVRMEDIMALFTDLAKVKFDEMERNSTLARDAQDAASRIGATLAGLKDGGKAAVSQQDLKFLSDKSIPILGGNGNATIDEFTASRTEAGSAEYKKEDLEAIKKSLESVSSRASDFVQQNQLKLQQLLQNFNTAVTMANSLQSMNAESTKSIAQAIR